MPNRSKAVHYNISRYRKVKYNRFYYQDNAQVGFALIVLLVALLMLVGQFYISSHNY